MNQINPDPDSRTDTFERQQPHPTARVVCKDHLIVFDANQHFELKTGERSYTHQFCIDGRTVAEFNAADCSGWWIDYPLMKEIIR